METYCTLEISQEQPSRVVYMYCNFQYNRDITDNIYSDAQKAERSLIIFPAASPRYL